MAQHDFNIANQGFPAFRSDLNNALSATVSLSSGSSQPSTMFAYQLWYDTSNNIIKQRNGDNDAWINLFAVNQTADTASPSTIDIVNDTTPQLGGNLDVNTKNIVFGDSGGVHLMIVWFLGRVQIYPSIMTPQIQTSSTQRVS